MGRSKQVLPAQVPTLGTNGYVRGNEINTAHTYDFNPYPANVKNMVSS